MGIRDSNDSSLVVNAVVVSHDKAQNVIRISLENCFNENINGKIEIYIIKGEQLYKYHGTVKLFRFNQYMIVNLFKGIFVEDRKHRRYNVDTKGAVEKIYFEQGNIELNKPVIVDVKNVSAGGVMFLSEPNNFTYNMKIKLLIHMKEKDTIVFCKIVRIYKLDEYLCEYGASLIMKEDVEDE